MPRIAQDTYHIHEVSVSCTDQGRYPHSRANILNKYPKNTTIIDRLDGEGIGYIDNPMLDLYNEDFLWGTAIQTARLQNDRRVLHPKRDRVLVLSKYIFYIYIVLYLTLLGASLKSVDGSGERTRSDIILGRLRTGIYTNMMVRTDHVWSCLILMIKVRSL